MTDEPRGACVVIGAGDGVGGAIAKAFAAEGLELILMAGPAGDAGPAMRISSRPWPTRSSPPAGRRGLTASTPGRRAK